MRANRELLIEGRGVLTEYSDVCITVVFRKHSITVSGTKLGLGAMNEERFSIVGRIERIEYTER